MFMCIQYIEVRYRRAPRACVRHGPSVTPWSTCRAVAGHLAGVLAMQIVYFELATGLVSVRVVMNLLVQTQTHNNLEVFRLQLPTVQVVLLIRSILYLACGGYNGSKAVRTVRLRA